MLTIPPKQQPYQLAYQLAFDALLAAPPGSERLSALGVTEVRGELLLPMLQHELRVNVPARAVVLQTGQPVKPAWGLLALHYLNAKVLDADERTVTFSHFDDCRAYLSVFNRRIIGRFLATTGRTARLFSERSEGLPAIHLPDLGVAYQYPLLPRVPLILVRYDDDGEFGPNATVIYRADIANLLPPEDRIVAVELLLDALTGKSIVEETACE